MAGSIGEGDSRTDRTTIPQDAARAGSAAPRTTHRIPIDLLLPGHSPRIGGEDREHIRRLAETESPLPPILVHRPTMRVIDGMHRLRAAELNGCREIDVAFFEGSEEEAFIRAVSENITHGLPLSLADRKAAAARILQSHPQLSDRAIASQTGLSGKTVSVIRRVNAGPTEPVARLGIDGRLRPVAPSEGRHRAAEMIKTHPGASLREIARVAHVSLGTAQDVRKRMRDGLPPIPHEPPETPDARREDRHRGLDSVVKRLTGDPSIRGTAAGRELLQRLRAGVMSPEERATMLGAVPAHRTASVAEAARECAEVWSRIAAEIEGRTSGS